MFDVCARFSMVHQLVHVVCVCHHLVGDQHLLLRCLVLLLEEKSIQQFASCRWLDWQLNHSPPIVLYFN